MQQHPNTQNQTQQQAQPQACTRVHKLQLNNLQGAAIVRVDEEGKIVAAVAAASRFRHSAKEDAVRVITPAACMRSLYEETMLITPQVVMVSGRERPLRAVVSIQDYPEYTEIIEALTPNGRWAQLTFGRIGVSPTFETNRRFLDDRWEIKTGTPATGVGRSFDLSGGATDAIVLSNRIPSAWHMMTALGKLIGGIEPRSVPTTDAPKPYTIEEMEATEQNFRRVRREKAFHNFQPHLEPTPHVVA